MREEGVIKFALEFTAAGPVAIPGLGELNAWRRILWQLGLIGQDADRYGGYSFGNVSRRVEPYDAPANRRPFVISGSQTGPPPALPLSVNTIPASTGWLRQDRSNPRRSP
jgi:hypothetical protein